MEPLTQTELFLLLAILWTLPWKGWALWLSARNTHKWWFVVLLILNTLAILDIIYIFAIGRKAQKERRGSGTGGTPQQSDDTEQ